LALRRPKIKKFVNVITFDEYFSKENCGHGGKIDLAIFARSKFGPEAMTHLYAYETSRQVNITHTDEIADLNKNLAKISVLPRDVKGNQPKRFANFPGKEI